jgi:hypothetical protein
LFDSSARRNRDRRGAFVRIDRAVTTCEGLPHIQQDECYPGDFSMTRKWPNLIAALMLTLMLKDAGAAAEPKPATGQEGDGLVKKAEEEGEVAIYATDSIGTAQSIWTAFQKRYPKIKLIGTSVGRGSDLFPKLFSERRAGKYLADVFLAGPTAVHLNLYPAKVLDPMPPALVHANVIDLTKWWQANITTSILKGSTTSCTNAPSTVLRCLSTRV